MADWQIIASRTFNLLQKKQKPQWEFAPGQNQDAVERYHHDCRINAGALMTRREKLGYGRSIIVKETLVFKQFTSQGAAP